MKSLMKNNIQDFMLCVIAKNDFSVISSVDNNDVLNIYIRLISNYMIDYIDYYVDYL